MPTSAADAAGDADARRALAVAVVCLVLAVLPRLLTLGARCCRCTPCARRAAHHAAQRRRAEASRADRGDARDAAAPCALQLPRTSRAHGDVPQTSPPRSTPPRAAQSPTVLSLLQASSSARPPGLSDPLSPQRAPSTPLSARQPGADREGHGARVSPLAAVDLAPQAQPTGASHRPPPPPPRPPPPPPLQRFLQPPSRLKDLRRHSQPVDADALRRALSSLRSDGAREAEPTAHDARHRRSAPSSTPPPAPALRAPASLLPERFVLAQAIALARHEASLRGDSDSHGLLVLDRALALVRQDAARSEAASLPRGEAAASSSQRQHDALRGSSTGSSSIAATLSRDDERHLVRELLAADPAPLPGRLGRELEAERARAAASARRAALSERAASLRVRSAPPDLRDVLLRR